MTLELEDGKLFFDLMWRLQFFVNRQRGFHTGVASREEYASLPTEKKLQAREALWEDPELIAGYVQANPDELLPDQLQILERWQGFVRGSFFILRHLKKGSIFIGKDDRVYAVHGIQDPLEEVMPSYYLPQMVEAVLLPFKGKIVYDGVLSGYSIHFGGGIRSTLNSTYMAAKENGRIITTLEPDIETAGLVQLRKSIAPQLQEVAGHLAKVKGESALQKSALALARANLALSLAEEEGNLAPADVEKHARKILRESRRLLERLDRLERY
jgi:hypothetical protein